MQRQSGFHQGSGQPLSNTPASLLFQRKWHPRLQHIHTIIFYGVLSVLFFIIGFWILTLNNSVKEALLKHYDTMPLLCLNNSCNFTISIKETMRPPIQFMYELQGYYQNHRRYIQSKNNKQLSGREITSYEAEISCSPVHLNELMGKTVSWKGQPLMPTAISNPCGLIARSFFNDTYRMYNPQGIPVPINEQNISWPGDKGRKYKRNPASQLNQWIDVENEHFIVWMRTAGLTTFKKLWGRIQQELQPGNYTLQVQNNYNTTQYHAHKSVYLTTTNGSIGGKNTLLSSLYFFLGVLCAMAGGLFLLRKRRQES